MGDVHAARVSIDCSTELGTCLASESPFFNVGFPTESSKAYISNIQYIDKFTIFSSTGIRFSVPWRRL